MFQDVDLSLRLFTCEFEHMETLEFVIHPDGRVEEKVTGIKGQSCEEVTKAIEEQLGCVLHTEKLAEYFAQTVQHSSYEASYTSRSEW